MNQSHWKNKYHQYIENNLSFWNDRIKESIPFNYQEYLQVISAIKNSYRIKNSKKREELIISLLFICVQTEFEKEIISLIKGYPHFLSKKIENQLNNFKLYTDYLDEKLSSDNPLSQFNSQILDCIRTASPKIFANQLSVERILEQFTHTNAIIIYQMLFQYNSNANSKHLDSYGKYITAKLDFDNRHYLQSLKKLSEIPYTTPQLDIEIELLRCIIHFQIGEIDNSEIIMDLIQKKLNNNIFIKHYQKKLDQCKGLMRLSFSSKTQRQNIYERKSSYNTSSLKKDSQNIAEINAIVDFYNFEIK